MIYLALCHFVASYIYYSIIFDSMNNPAYKRDIVSDELYERGEAIICSLIFPIHFVFLLLIK